MKETYTLLPDFSYRGARAMILLQDRYLREFLAAWKRGKALKIEFPKTDDSDYQSWDTILFHVLRASRGYLTWLCDKLALPAPPVKPTPELAVVENEAEDYLNHLHECWTTPFISVPEQEWDKVYKTRWNVDFCLDSMLEHSVMHPIRHTFQIEEWIQRHQAAKP